MEEKKRPGNLWGFVLIVIISVIIVEGTYGGLSQNDSEEAIVGPSGGESSQFLPVEDSRILAYDVDTSVVYYMFTASESAGRKGYGYAYFAPYVSANGRFCRYVNGEIVEIDNRSEAHTSAEVGSDSPSDEEGSTTADPSNLASGISK